MGSFKILDTREQHFFSYSSFSKLKERIAQACELAQGNLKAAQTRMKTWYDKKAVDRQFKPGDKVLMLTGEIIFYNSRGIEVATLPVNQDRVTIAACPHQPYVEVVPWQELGPVHRGGEQIARIEAASADDEMQPAVAGEIGHVDAMVLAGEG